MENLDLTPLCKFCFATLEKALKIESTPKFPEEFKDKSFPLFVTWTIGKEKELRGCIGTFTSDNLEKNLQKYTLISAFKDYRFTPIEKSELKNLNCEVSLLVKFEKANDPMDWVVGTHGIDIDFEDEKGEDYSATFLPEVAEEEKWDQRTTLEYLIRKAGYNGPLDKVLGNMKVTRYQSLKKTISYEEYKK